MVTRERILLGVLGGVTLVAAVSVWLRPREEPASPAASGPARGTGGPAVPRIGLDRIARSAGGAEAGVRDLFDFGQVAAPVGVERPPPVVAVEQPPVVTIPAAPTPVPLPPLTVKYIGSVEGQGRRVAFFLTDKREVLTGQVGDTVMNRFRVMKIGFESVDVQQVGSEHVQRIPLRGN